MYRGKRPNSPYSIECGVPCFTLRILMLEEICVHFSIIFKFPNPQTSQPYFKIGTMVLSNNFNCQSIGKSKFRIFL